MSREQEDKKDTIHTPGGLFPNGLFFEQVKDQQYLMWGVDDENNAVLMTKDYVTYDKMYLPLERVPWPLCKEAREYGNADTLLKEIREFIYEHLDLPNKNLYDVLAAWILTTWTNELWQVVAYPTFLGPTNTGKTRGLEVLHALGYRIVLSSNISAAILYRMCEQWHPTILLDETEIYHQKEKTEIIHLLNSGYRRGQYAFRCNDKGVIEAFDVFGNKALAGTQSPPRTLEGRGILIHMMKNRRKIRLFIDKDKAHTIRCKLLMYRMKTLQLKATKENIEKTVQARLDEIFERLVKNVPSLEFADSRLQELFQNVLAVSNSGHEAILEVVKGVAKSRAAEEMTTEEAEMVRILAKSNDDLILSKDLKELFNETRSEKEKWKTRSIGWLMKRLGFQKKHTKKGNGWLIDKGRLQHLAEIYLRGSPPSTLESSQVHQNHEKGELLNFSEQTGGRGVLTVQEVVEKVRPYLTPCFETDKLVQQIRGLGCTREEAEKFFQFFVDHEMVGRDDAGLWHWTLKR